MSVIEGRFQQDAVYLLKTIVMTKFIIKKKINDNIELFMSTYPFNEKSFGTDARVNCPPRVFHIEQSYIFIFSCAD